MNTNRTIRVFLFIAGLVAAGAAQAMVGTIAVGMGRMQEVGEIQTSFVADAILETEDMTATTRVFYQPGMVRDEISFGGQQMITIRRFDLGLVWTIMGQGMYMESAIDERNERAPDYKLISREIVGPEIVNGMATIKYKSVYESADGRFGGFTWFTEDNIAVKGFMVSETDGEKQRIKYEFTSLARGGQDDELFELPAGSQKFNMPDFSGMQGMGQGGPGSSYGAPPGGVPPGATDYSYSDNDANPQAPATDYTFNDMDADGQAPPEEEGIADVVADEAKRGAEQETRRGVRDSIRKGFGKIFGR